MRPLARTFALVFAALLAVPLAAQATPPPDAPSLYDFPQQFTDQNGKSVTLAEVGKGHPVLISMFYASCPAACPLLINKLQHLESKLSPAQRSQVRVILVTLDPKHDDRAALQNLQKAHGIDGSRWSLLRTNDEGVVRSLAAVLGIKYRFLPNGMINHSSVITFVAPNGAIAARMDGLGANEAQVLEPLKAASSGTLAAAH